MNYAIRITDFRKSFGKKLVHNNVSIEVGKSETVGLIGGSGAGKSVILRSLIGLEKPDSGKVEVLGIDVSNYSEDDFLPIRKRVAYCFQNGALFDSMTVFDNLAYPLVEHTQLSKQQISEKVMLTLSRFGLDGNESLFPASLSGGMQKRLGVARAIILGPEVILYDEPTSGLDPSNTRKIEAMMIDLKKTGVSSILVTHDMKSAFRVCDRIVMLNQGRIVASGTPQELENQHDSVIHKFVNGEAF